MPSTRKKMFTLRIDEEVHDKIKVIADENNRSTANYIEWLCKNCIDDYEKRNGAIYVQSSQA